MYKSQQELIDHLEIECPKANVICLTCSLESKREEDEAHECTQELIKNVNMTDNQTLKAVLKELDRKNTDENAVRDGQN